MPHVRFFSYLGEWLRIRPTLRARRVSKPAHELFSRARSDGREPEHLLADIGPGQDTPQIAKVVVV